jgi:hypothetical protein
VDPPEDEPWKPNTVVDDFWGPDETEFWAEHEAKKKALAKTERPSLPKPLSVNQLPIKEIEWEQPDNPEPSLLQDIKKAHQELPKPLTYTVVNPKSDPNAPETKRRIFANLHKQLIREVGVAVEKGIAMSFAPEVWDEINGHAGKPVDDWEDVDMAVFERRVRELVRMLIAKRREAAVAG